MRVVIVSTVVTPSPTRAGVAPLWLGLALSRIYVVFAIGILNTSFTFYLRVLYFYEDLFRVILKALVIFSFDEGTVWWRKTLFVILISRQGIHAIAWTLDCLWDAEKKIKYVCLYTDSIVTSSCIEGRNRKILKAKKTDSEQRRKIQHYNIFFRLHFYQKISRMSSMCIIYTQTFSVSIRPYSVLIREYNNGWRNDSTQPRMSADSHHKHTVCSIQKRFIHRPLTQHAILPGLAGSRYVCNSLEGGSLWYRTDCGAVQTVFLGAFRSYVPARPAARQSS